MHATVPELALVLKAQSLSMIPVLQVAVLVLGPVPVLALALGYHHEQGVVLIPPQALFMVEGEDFVDVSETIE